MQDGFSFELAEVVEELEGAPGGSLRVRVMARLSGMPFGVFHLDLSSGDALVGPPDILRGSNLLEFAGIPPIEFPVYPVAQQLAEKLHAYTLPRAQENTRIKDLADLAFFAASETVDAGRLQESVEATFTVRRTHDVPVRLPQPPVSWEQPFSSMAREVRNLPFDSLATAYGLAAEFWGPFLSETTAERTWQPSERRWATKN